MGNTNFKVQGPDKPREAGQAAGRATKREAATLPQSKEKPLKNRLGPKPRTQTLHTFYAAVMQVRVKGAAKADVAWQHWHS